jgi:hypothetical protein
MWDCNQLLLAARESAGAANKLDAQRKTQSPGEHIAGDENRRLPPPRK